jgi:hypothetical protein
MHKNNPTKSYLKIASASAVLLLMHTHKSPQATTLQVDRKRQISPSSSSVPLHNANLTPSCRLKPPPSQTRDAQLGSSLQPYKTPSPAEPVPIPMGCGWAWVLCIQLQIGVKLLGCREYANQEALRAEVSDSERPFICLIQPRLGVGG